MSEAGFAWVGLKEPALSADIRRGGGGRLEVAGQAIGETHV
ncbi:MAG: hypothetical protein AAF982_02355 [Pseudomonadota bacterium]